MSEAVELARAFASSPSAETWQTFCATVNALEDDAGLPSKLEECDGALEYSDSRFRRPTPEWLEGFPERIDPRLAVCRTIDLSGRDLGDAGVEALAAAPALARVETLILRDNLITANSILALASNLQRLMTLDLSRNDLGPDGLARLTQGKLLRLRQLHLQDCRIGDDGLVAFSESPGFPKLGVLMFARNDVTEFGALALAEASHLEELRHLELSDNPIGQEGARALASGNFPRLGRLLLRSTNLNDKGIRFLVWSATLPSLCELDLRDNPWGVDGSTNLKSRGFMRDGDLWAKD